MPKIFDIEGPRDLFDTIEFRFSEYCHESEKSTEDIIAIIMMVNHLREWIAPGYEKKNGVWPKPDSPQQVFSQLVYEHPSFDVIRSLCNGTKHPQSLKKVTLTLFENEHPNIPSNHTVDGRPVQAYIEPIMALYRDWFAAQENPK